VSHSRKTFAFLFWIALVVPAAVWLGGCARPMEKQEVQDPAALRAAIKDLDRAFSAAFERNDTLVISSLYTDDAMLLPPNHEPVLGRDSIAAYWAPLLTPALKTLHLETTEVGGAGDDVYEVGSYTILAADGSTTDRGKYVVLLKRQSDGGWRLYRDMWNSSLPAPAPAAGM
jgi:uncharacterized protein (TIGR02246 family)